MKSYFLFTASGPLVILTSYQTIEAPRLLVRLASKGISKFVACEVPVKAVRVKYGKHFEVVLSDLHENDDLRVLDYNGDRAFKKFKFAELGEPIYHEAPVEDEIEIPAYYGIAVD